MGGVWIGLKGFVIIVALMLIVPLESLNLHHSSINAHLNKGMSEHGKSYKKPVDSENWTVL
jgi:hypothetical protein